ncbi:cupin domain-containing protein [Paenarthrobacter sp. RAF54_2]|uniref:cupin domain-containing protein n=1 Tax=Paenarthrobacter sp. RAF54_2 TaxID=3233061 RepID=UPI003F957312
MVHPTHGETVMAGAVPTKFEITAEMVGGAYCIVRQSIEPGQLFWPHVHKVEDQILVVLKGNLGVRVGDREWTAAAGEVVYRPHGEPHTVWNAGSEAVEMLEITSPGRFDEYFASLGQLTVAGDEAGRAQLLERFSVQGVDGWADDLSLRYGVKL